MRTVLNGAGAGPTTLDRVSAGDCVIVRLVTAGSPALVGRLRAMGLCEGRRVQVVRQGPRPIVTTMGARLALHRDLVRGVQVEHCDQNCQSSQPAVGAPEPVTLTTHGAPR